MHTLYRWCFQFFTHIFRSILLLVPLGCVISLVAMTQFSFSYAGHADTTTPIKHVVILFPENISFDHYFGTYPFAANIDGEMLQGSDEMAPFFFAKPHTPIPNNYLQPNESLQSYKPEFITPNPLNNHGYLPFRLSPTQALTCDQTHAYTDEQIAFNNGKMNKFFEVNATNAEDCKNPPAMLKRNDLVMGYYDGNTVAAYWNLAQNFVLNDNNYGSVFGPSTPGAINLIAGQTGHAVAHDPITKKIVRDTYNLVYGDSSSTTGTLIDDPDPWYDDCSNRNGKDASALAEIRAPNIGDTLTKYHITWGWFQGGFAPDLRTSQGKAICARSHTNVGSIAVRDYSPHHEPFQYFSSTANPHHLPPSQPALIGHDDQAHHQYDLEDFSTALAQGNLPAVSFIKPPVAYDGHASSSDPISENQFTARLVNQLQQSPQWDSTALIIAYDDSDGWYDHQSAPILNGSHTSADRAICLRQAIVAEGIQGRCGPGTRHPLLIVSPYVGANVINSTFTEQTSIMRFIEENWKLPLLGHGAFDQRATSLTGFFDFTQPPRKDKVWLDEKTGAITIKEMVTPLHQGAIVYQQIAQAADQLSWFDSWGKVIVCIVSIVAYLAGAGYLLSRKYGR